MPNLVEKPRVAFPEDEALALAREISRLLHEAPPQPRCVKRSFAHMKMLFSYARDRRAWTFYLFEMGSIGVDENPHKAFLKMLSMLRSQLEFVVEEGSWKSWPPRAGASWYAKWLIEQALFSVVKIIVHVYKRFPVGLEIEEFDQLKSKVSERAMAMAC